MGKTIKFKLRSVFTGLALFTSANLFAANFNNDESIAITPPITGAGKIIRVTVNFKDNIDGSIAALSPVNTGIALSQNAVTAWTEYSAYARFDNADLNTKGIIEARNDGAMAAANDLLFDLTKSYYVWFTLDVPKNKYSVSAQDASTTDVIKIATDYTFRAKAIASVGYINILHNGDNGDGAILKISEVTYPTTIEAGPIITQPTSIKSALSTQKLTAHVYGNEVKFNQVVKTASVMGLNGKTLSNHTNVTSINLDHITSGICIVKTEAGIVKIVK